MLLPPRRHGTDSIRTLSAARAGGSWGSSGRPAWVCCGGGSVWSADGGGTTPAASSMGARPIGGSRRVPVSWLGRNSAGPVEPGAPNR